ncbi:MAG: glycosyl transferase GT4 family protein [Methanobacteriaceae archaeon]|nr:glycosyl transferase GT4 family protein [Methanobacteriaceae archaeon]
MRKVILIAFYFNQVNEIASKRLRALAKYLPEFGWEPIVIVPDLGSVPDENANLNCRIITTDYEDMFSRYLNKIKPSNSENLDNDSNSNSNNSSQDKLKDSTSVSNPLVSKAISMAGEVFAYPDGMKYWYEPAFKAASEIIENEDIDGIISSSWPITAHKIAKSLSDKYNIPWIADLRDLWNLNPYVSHTAIRSHFEKNLELKIFENVDVLTTTTDLAKETLATLHPDTRIDSVLSGYDEDDFKFLNEYSNQNEIQSSKAHDKLNFIYAGSLYAGKRDPTLLFKAIRQLEDEGKLDSSKIAIDFYGDSGNIDEIANNYGLLDIVNIGGRISHDEVLKKQLSSDILLLISWNNEKEKIFIPGKVYEYFALQRPVLSIGYKEGSLKDLIEKTNIGYHVSDLKSTKDAVLSFYNEFIENGFIQFKESENIKDYSMVEMAHNFANLLDDINK